MRYLHSTPPFVALPDARGRHEKPPPASLLAAAVHAQSEGMLIATRRWTTKGLRILFANDSLCAMTGYTMAELRELGQAFLHGEKKNIEQLHRWQTHVKPGTTLGGEGSLTRKDGTRLYTSWTYSPISDEHGHVTHIVATFRDLTERRRLQDALIHSQRLDAVGRLAGGVAHDFNNLLSVINGYCEMMASRPEVRELAANELEEIHLASQKAANLVKQLLAFSRRQANNPRVINLDRLVQDNTSILSRLLQPARGIEVTLDAGDANIRADPTQLVQVLLNLTLNARDALPAGGRMTIRTEHRIISKKQGDSQPDAPPKGRYAVLSVADNGTGMNEDVRAHLFEPFFTTKEPGRGTGLGLALVYGVVKQSNGHIQVQSTPGAGTTFEIFLPVVDEPALPVATASSLPPFPIAAPGRECVLLIEADTMLRKMIADIFSTDGYTVLASANAAEARERLETSARPVDLLITQIATRPGGEEETLVRRLHAERPALSVLALCNPECAPLDFLPPANRACVIKPFTLNTLLKAARALLDVRTS